ncbi:type IV fimbrial biogenesis protein FimT [Pseudoxanthomonas sp. GM95]|uniref:GspH/FimT family pseudopilin n=1 Tax=Pseudoxanthomonas sp. GM95 TaxID=1881043 RepID=UPI0008C4D720|nr:Tfp pilus assembly protein FimT/FimU [Pseudoxanthomonas sp. GM95]SEK69056.1 type IV fimbrial biogenesis protein FimT [Pseudoxanthomonas sp. GM95]
MDAKLPQIASPATSRRRIAGFSLIEATVVMAVASIGLAVGLPSYSSVIQHQRESAATNLLSSFMASARSTAVTYHMPTVVCPNDGNNQCRDDSDWTQGWIMFYDANGNHRPDGPDDLLRVEAGPRDPGLRIISTSGRPRVTFLPSGSAGGSNLTIRLCRDQHARAAVIVNRSGRTRVEKPDNSDGCQA